MGTMDDKVLKVVETAGETILKHSERWSLPQKVVAGLVCFLAAAALISGVDNLRVASGIGIALFGVSFLTFRRRLVEAETLVLKDRAGRVRIAANAEQGLVFLDERMRVKILVNLVDGEPLIHLGSQDTAKVWLRASPNEAGISVQGAAPAGSGPIAYLRARESGSSAMVGQLDGAGLEIVGATDGNVGLVLKNGEQKSLAVLGCVQSTSHLSFFLPGKDQPFASYPPSKVVAQAATGQATT